ncbi:trichohyalin-like [Notolabrus celidotus]|uniref:trichohyalin-like n=1 Tax=Notolabrus celidotus TaxID=1203425 RepID=UPI00148FC246|nr:trichohyalin-like [Notolabrus celidotus]
MISKTRSSKTDENMSTNETKRRHSPPEKMHGSIYTQAQRGVEPDRRADQYSQLFPSKPVNPRRPNYPKTHNSHDLFDFEKITITKQQRGPLSSRDHHSTGRETSGSRHPQRKDTLRLARGELEMTRRIQEEQLMLHDKLWKLEAKVREKIHRDVKDAAHDYDRGQAERRETQKQTRLPEQQRREPVRTRGMQDRRHEDGKQQIERQDQRMEDRMRYTHEEKKTTWKEERREVDSEHLQRKGRQGTQMNKSRFENVKEHARGKGGYEADDGICKKRGERPTEKAKEREQSSTSLVDKGRTRERKYREMYESDNNPQVTQMSQHKTSHQAATQNYRGAERKQPKEPLHPPDYSSSHSRRQEQEQLSRMDSENPSFQLLPCKVCNRKFASKRLEKHVLICEKDKHSQRQVYNSFAHRVKGSSLEDYLKTHYRSKTPEFGSSFKGRPKQLMKKL